MKKNSVRSLIRSNREPLSIKSKCILVSGEGLLTGRGTTGDGTIHLHYTKKAHGHQATSHHVDHNPEIYCIPRDGRLIVFRLDASTTIGVGDFERFTHRLEVWVPLRCESCGLTQLMDMGVTFVDESGLDDRSFDRGKSRIYGGHFACPSCTGTIKVEIEFEYYASAARFSRYAMDGAKIILLAGLRDFFKSAKSSSIPGHNSESREKQGSLMHFG